MFTFVDVIGYEPHWHFCRTCHILFVLFMNWLSYWWSYGKEGCQDNSCLSWLCFNICKCNITEYFWKFLAMFMVTKPVFKARPWSFSNPKMFFILKPNQTTGTMFGHDIKLNQKKPSSVTTYRNLHFQHISGLQKGAMPNLLWRLGWEKNAHL